jgi:hypothetical protein
MVNVPISMIPSAQLEARSALYFISLNLPTLIKSLNFAEARSALYFISLIKSLNFAGLLEYFTAISLIF